MPRRKAPQEEIKASISAIRMKSLIYLNFYAVSDARLVDAENGTRIPLEVVNANLYLLERKRSKGGTLSIPIYVPNPRPP